MKMESFKFLSLALDGIVSRPRTPPKILLLFLLTFSMAVADDIHQQTSAQLVLVVPTTAAFNASIDVTVVLVVTPTPLQGNLTDPANRVNRTTYARLRVVGDAAFVDCRLVNGLGFATIALRQCGKSRVVAVLAPSEAGLRGLTSAFYDITTVATGASTLNRLSFDAASTFSRQHVVLRAGTATVPSILYATDACGERRVVIAPNASIACTIVDSLGQTIAALPVTFGNMSDSATPGPQGVVVTVPTALVSKVVCGIALRFSINGVDGPSITVTATVAPPITDDLAVVEATATLMEDSRTVRVAGTLVRSDGGLFVQQQATTPDPLASIVLSVALLGHPVQQFVVAQGSAAFDTNVTVNTTLLGLATHTQCVDVANLVLRISAEACRSGLVDNDTATVCVRVPWKRIPIQWTDRMPPVGGVALRFGASPLLWASSVEGFTNTSIVSSNQLDTVTIEQLFVIAVDACDAVVSSFGPDGNATVDLGVGGGVVAAVVALGRPFTNVSLPRATTNITLRLWVNGKLMCTTVAPIVSAAGSRLDVSLWGGLGAPITAFGGEDATIPDGTSLHAIAGAPWELHLAATNRATMLLDAPESIRVYMAPVHNNVLDGRSLHLRLDPNDGSNALQWLSNATTQFGIATVPVRTAGCADVGLSRLVFVVGDGSRAYITGPIRMRNSARYEAASVDVLASAQTAAIPFLARDVCGEPVAAGPSPRTPQMTVTTRVGYAYTLRGAAAVSGGRGPSGMFCSTALPQGASIEVGLVDDYLAPPSLFAIPTAAASIRDVNVSATAPPSANATVSTAAPTPSTTIAPIITPAPTPPCYSVVCPDDGACVASPDLCTCAQQSTIRDVRVATQTGNVVPSTVDASSTLLLRAAATLRSDACAGAAFALEPYLRYSWEVLFADNHSAIALPTSVVQNASSFACNASLLPRTIGVAIRLVVSAPAVTSATVVAALVNLSVTYTQPTVSITDQGASMDVPARNIFLPARVVDVGRVPTACAWACVSAGCPTSITTAFTALNQLTTAAACKAARIAGPVASGTYNVTLTYSGGESPVTSSVLTVVVDQDHQRPIPFLQFATTPMFSDNVFAAAQELQFVPAVSYNGSLYYVWSVNGANVSTAAVLAVAASTLVVSTDVVAHPVANTIQLYAIAQSDPSLVGVAARTVFVAAQPTIALGAPQHMASSEGAAAFAALQDTVVVSVATTGLLPTMQALVVVGVEETNVGGGRRFRPLSSVFNGTHLWFTTPLPATAASGGSDATTAVATCRVDLKLGTAGRVMASSNVSMLVTLPPREAAMSAQLTSLRAAASGSSSTTAALDASSACTALLQASGNATLKEAAASAVLDALGSLVPSPGGASAPAAQLSQTEQGQVIQSLVDIVGAMPNTTGLDGRLADLLHRTITASGFDAASNGLATLVVLSKLSGGTANSTTAALRHATIDALAQAIVSSAPLGTPSVVVSDGVAVMGIRQTASAFGGSHVASANATCTIPTGFALTGSDGQGLDPTAVITIAGSTQQADSFADAAVGTTGTMRTTVATYDIFVDGARVRIENLSSPIAMSFALTSAAAGAVSCRYYDTTTGAWSSAGIHVTAASSTAVYCSTTHLSSFAAFASSAAGSCAGWGLSALVSLVLVAVVPYF